MTETLAYKVVQKQDDMEIRAYGGHIQAEVTVSGRDHKTAVENGFGVLAGYIFGNNIARQKIEMTTPVTAASQMPAAEAQKIAMTTPVTVSGGDNFTVAFIMPSEHNMETLPLPRDHRVAIREVPAHRMAAVRFSGYFNRQRIEENKQRLARWLGEQGLEPDGDFVVAGYNPPWVPGFLARNEVLVQVK